MFESLKPWMSCSVTVHPFDKLTASGEKTYKEPQQILAYIVGGVEVVNDMSGNEVVSNTQVYFDPSKYTINPNDCIEVEGQTKNIISISTWYDGNTGQASIKQVFL